MRTALGLAVLSVGIMACGTAQADRGTATASLKRDITLQGSATEELQVASPVELGRPGTSAAQHSTAEAHAEAGARAFDP